MGWNPPARKPPRFARLSNLRRAGGAGAFAGAARWWLSLVSWFMHSTSPEGFAHVLRFQFLAAWHEGLAVG